MKNSSGGTLGTLGTLSGVDDDKLLKTWEVEEILNISRKTVYKLVKMGALKRRELRKKVHRYSKREVMALVEMKIIDENRRVDKQGLHAEMEKN